MITLRITLPSGDELTFKVKDQESANQVKEEFCECKIEILSETEGNL